MKYVTTDGIIFKAVKDDMLETVSEAEARIFTEGMQALLRMQDKVNELLKTEKI